MTIRTIVESYPVYKSLVMLYRGLPKEMFVSRILRDEASCKVRLGEMRSTLFEYIKESEDFPYGLQCMMKCRIGTRSGDTVAVKLAHDIHTVMSVLEGAEYSDMRELISSGSGKSQRSQSVLSSADETFAQCESSSELKVLSDTVNTLQADLLHMKQTHTALETARSKEFQTMKSTILGLKSDLSILTTTVKSAVVNITLCAERIESEKSLGVTHLKNELKLLKLNANSMQESIDTVQSQVALNKASILRRHKPGSKVRDGQNVSSPGGSPDLPPRQSSDMYGGTVGEAGHAQGSSTNLSTGLNGNENAPGTCNSNVGSSHTVEPLGPGPAVLRSGDTADAVPAGSGR